MRPIEVFIQGEGFADITVVVAEGADTIAAVLAKLDVKQATNDDLHVYLEDVHAPLERDAVIEELLPLAPDEETILGPLRLHLSRCRRIEVVVRFNGEEAERRFAPSATVERVRRWAARRAFGLSPRDAAEHVLQLPDSSTRPDRDVHIGTLTHGKTCAVAFDLVPSKRVEG